MNDPTKTTEAELNQEEVDTTDNFEKSVEWTAQAKGRSEAYRSMLDILVNAPTDRLQRQEYLDLLIGDVEDWTNRLNDQLRQMESWTFEDEPLHDDHIAHNRSVESKITFTKECLEGSRLKLSAIRRLRFEWKKKA